MSKLLSFKQKSAVPAPQPPRWQVGIDKRQVILYVAIALITGFTLGFYYARSTQKAQTVPTTENLAAAPTANAGEQPKDSLRSVTRIVRGDTIEIEGMGTVRLIGVDTPDGKPQYSEQGKKARDFAEKSLRGQKVRVEFDESFAANQNKDASGKTLVYVYLQDGTLFNKELLKRGHAFLHVSEPFSKMEEFRSSEGEAMQAMRGLWGPEENSSKVASASKQAEGDGSKKASSLLPSEIGPNLPATMTSSPAEPIVFLSGLDKLYHKENCELLSKKKTALSLSQAKASGHTPCGRCYASTVLKVR